MYLAKALVLAIVSASISTSSPLAIHSLFSSDPSAQIVPREAPKLHDWKTINAEIREIAIAIEIFHAPASEEMVTAAFEKATESLKKYIRSISVE